MSYISTHLTEQNVGSHRNTRFQSSSALESLVYPDRFMASAKALANAAGSQVRGENEFRTDIMLLPIPVSAVDCAATPFVYFRKWAAMMMLHCRISLWGIGSPAVTTMMFRNAAHRSGTKRDYGY